MIRLNSLFLAHWDLKKTLKFIFSGGGLSAADCMDLPLPLSFMGLHGHSFIKVFCKLHNSFFAVDSYSGIESCWVIWSRR